MIGVCISGARGRMGRMLVELVHQAKDLHLASALERPGHPELGMALGDGVALTDSARRAIEAAEVLVDFSLPEAMVGHLGLAQQLGRPAVSGTTGLSAAQQEAVRQAAREIAVVFASNMSRGVFVLCRLVQEAASALSAYDAEIFEIHHRNKADAPSGTALQLAELVRAAGVATQPVYARQGRRAEAEVGLSAARGGDVVGEHQVMFLGPGEQLILTHRATSREHFCQGALEAVRFVVGRKAGLYGMAEVFGEG